MRHSTWQFRAFALLQLLLALPPMVSGSVCFSTDGSARPEFGLCACDVPFVGTTEATIASAGAVDCGPCRDEVFSAIRTVLRDGPRAPMPSLLRTALCVTVAAPAAPSPGRMGLGQPPGERPFILRC
jgi:hypothetical protein